MTFTGAKIKEQGITFALAVVKPHVLTSPTIETTRASFLPIFGNVPIILVGKNANGSLKYNGRTDIVRFLSKINPTRIPWKQYTVN